MTEPRRQVVTVVADLEDEDVEDMQTAWDVIDDLLDHLFSNPPTPGAQAEITFSYEGYRVTVEQNGTAKFVKTA